MISEAMKELVISEYIPVSLIDFPGNIASVVFTHGCNLRCRYCHNPELVNREPGWNKIDEFFEGLRAKDIEGVAVSGGEPLFNREVIPFLEKLKSEGFKVKLDTNGSLPTRLSEVCSSGLVDFISIDLKAFNDEDLQYVTRTGYSLSDFEASVGIVKEHGLAYEVRHTLWKVPDSEDVDNIMPKIDGSLIVQYPVKNGFWLDKRFKIELNGDDYKNIRELFKGYSVKYRNDFEN